MMDAIESRLRRRLRIEEAAAILALVPLAEGAAARGFGIDWMYIDTEPERARWYAFAVLPGSRITTGDHHTGPAAAADELAALLMEHLSCPWCSAPLSALPRAGHCAWRRTRISWRPGCRPVNHSHRAAHTLAASATPKEHLMADTGEYEAHTESAPEPAAVQVDDAGKDPAPFTTQAEQEWIARTRLQRSQHMAEMTTAVAAALDALAEIDTASEALIVMPDPIDDEKDWLDWRDRTLPATYAEEARTVLQRLAALIRPHPGTPLWPQIAPQWADRTYDSPQTELGIFVTTADGTKAVLGPHHSARHAQFKADQLLLRGDATAAIVRRRRRHYTDWEDVVAGDDE